VFGAFLLVGEQVVRERAVFLGRLAAARPGAGDGLRSDELALALE